MKSMFLLAAAVALSLPVHLQAQQSEPNDQSDRVVTISSMEFLPVQNDITHSVDPNTGYRTFAHPLPSGRGAYQLVAPVHLPDGAVVTGISLDFCRMDGGMQAWLEEICTQGNCGGVSINEVVRTYYADPNTCGKDYVPITSRSAIDNQTKQYFISASFSCSAPQFVSFRAVRLFYKMELVSAPPVASFSDVPMTSPYYRSIEALYAAGGTAGCGNGKYCPEAPVTREQLAAILAQLLGLGW